MSRNGVDYPNFKGFMADSAIANWNAIRIVYGTGSANEKMENRENVFVTLDKFSSKAHTEAYQRTILTAT